MIGRTFWLNLPVQNIEKSKEFYQKIGFRLSADSKGNSAHSACFILSEKEVILMLFDEETFKNFIGQDPAKTKTQVLLSISADSKEEVDAIAQKAITEGGKSQHKPAPMQGWMYGCNFSDLDGHLWNVLFMNEALIK